MLPSQANFVSHKLRANNNEDKSPRLSGHLAMFIFSMGIILGYYLFVRMPIAQAQGQSGETVNFSITGYYSPLPNQQFYLTGNYESEIRLNGKGRFGADGEPVYPGMIAASSNWAFGTKICIPEFGCGTVHDRGQAIVEQGQRDVAKYDRLDLWMGYGDAGLWRALNWGLRHLPGTVYPPTANIADSVIFADAGLWQEVITLPEKIIFTDNLNLGDQGEQVSFLQKKLAILGYWQKEINGQYDESLRKSIQALQKKHSLIIDDQSPGAGRFGPQTREALSQALYQQEVQDNLRTMWDNLHFSENIYQGKRSPQVWQLQETLARWEILKVEPTGFYGPKTNQAITEFQIKNNIIDNTKQLGAGNFGPQTREKLNAILSSQQSKQSQIAKSWQQKKQTQHRLASLGQQQNLWGSPLVQNTTGPLVHKLQTQLQQLGYLAVNPTGFYGPLTAQAVAKLQQDHDLVIPTANSGQFTPRTSAILWKIINS